MWNNLPHDHHQAADILEGYRHFYNHDRANQSLACDNRPPYEAFPFLPPLPHLPSLVNPDAWLQHYHRRIFKRRVDRSGSISVGNHPYYVGYQLARERVGVLLDADKRVFHLLHHGQVIRELEIAGLIGQPLPFQDYLKRLLAETRSLKTV